ncbi:MAG: FecR domain-containing protein [Pedosphaera parvula]|nr:FecR domain-containing protein [Pedosphaera parvula]
MPVNGLETSSFYRVMLSYAYQEHPMKIFQSISQAVACLAAVALVCLFSPTTQGAAKAGAEQGQVIVVEVNGQASYTDGGQYVPLQKGAKLNQGTSIKTGPNSSVIIFLTNNKTELTIDASTTVNVDKLTSTKTGADTVSETEMELKEGKITGNVKKLSRASTFNVKTPVGVAGIRGTMFLVQANGVIHVLQGTVVITYVNPSTGVATPVTINAGQTFTPPANPAAPGARPTLAVINADVENTIVLQTRRMALVVSENPIVNIVIDQGATGPTVVIKPPDTFVTPTTP